MRSLPKITLKLAVAACLRLVRHCPLGQLMTSPGCSARVGDIISLPFQSNTNFGFGKLDNTQNILDMQPVIPVHLNQDWNLVTRWIMPVIYQPPFFAGDATDFGLGDLTPEFFISPKNPIPLAPGLGLVWGAGPAFQLPTATDRRLGSGMWSAGPGLVALLLSQRQNVVTGFEVNNLWSFASEEDHRADVNAMTFSPSSITTCPRAGI